MSIFKPKYFLPVGIALIALGTILFFLLRQVPPSLPPVVEDISQAPPLPSAEAGSDVAESSVAPEPDAGTAQSHTGTVDENTPAYTGADHPAEPLSPDAIDGEHLFRFYNAADQRAFESYAKAHGIAVLDSMTVGHVTRIKVQNRAQLQDLLKNAPVAVEHEPNIYVRLPEQNKQPMQAPPKGYRPFGKDTLAWLGIGDNQGWGNGIKVAVLDSGVNAEGGLKGKYIDRVDLSDDDSASGLHGTAVASIIAGDSTNLRGVAPDADIMSLRVLSDKGSGNAFTLAKGIIDAVDRGAKIINMSLGSKSDSFVVRDAVHYATERGVLLVAAVGNDAVEGVQYPAAYPDVLSVGGVDANGEHLYFSNRGKVDVAAPGIGVEIPLDNKNILFSGTSAAAPFVSGAAAAIWAQNPELSATDVRDIILANSDDGGAPGTDADVGAGVLNLKRIEQRNTPGIYDMSIMTPFVTTDENGIHLDLSAQNRGTEPIESASLEVSINGAPPQPFIFNNIGVGETASQHFDLPPTDKDLELRYYITPEGISDANPSDNGMISRINQFQPRKPDEK